MAPVQRRDAVLRAMKGHLISQRRAGVLIGVDPKTVRRGHPPDNPAIRMAMNKIAEKRRRFGYRRVGVVLERAGMVKNEKTLYRIYREDGGGLKNSPGACFPDDAVGAAAAEPALVAGLSVRHLRGLPEVPHPGRE
jgi:putative transposase